MIQTRDHWLTRSAMAFHPFAGYPFRISSLLWTCTSSSTSNQVQPSWSYKSPLLRYLHRQLLSPSLSNPRIENTSGHSPTFIHQPQQESSIKSFIPSRRYAKSVASKSVVLHRKARIIKHAKARKRKEQDIRWPPPCATLGYSVFNTQTVCCQRQKKGRNWSKTAGRKQ